MIKGFLELNFKGFALKASNKMILFQIHPLGDCFYYSRCYYINCSTWNGPPGRNQTNSFILALNKLHMFYIETIAWKLLANRFHRIHSGELKNALWLLTKVHETCNARFIKLAIKDLKILFFSKQKWLFQSTATSCRSSCSSPSSPTSWSSWCWARSTWGRRLTLSSCRWPFRIFWRSFFQLHGNVFHCFNYVVTMMICMQTSA